MDFNKKIANVFEKIKTIMYYYQNGIHVESNIRFELVVSISNLQNECKLKLMSISKISSQNVKLGQSVAMLDGWGYEV